MDWKRQLKTVSQWALRGAAVFMIPTFFPSTVSLGDRVGWMGAVLLWFYIGRLIDQRTNDTDE